VTTDIAVTCRLARPADDALLAAFDCPSSDPRVETYVRNTALSVYLAGEGDYRLLLWTTIDGTLVAVAAHRRNWRAVLRDSNDAVPGTEIVVLGIAEPFRDSTRDGRRLVQTIVDEMLRDIHSRERGDLLLMLVAPHNDDGQHAITWFDAERGGTCDDDDVFVRVNR
jgi:ribosomal protein S18 acetylase RimI-like enzyme